MVSTQLPNRLWTRHEAISEPKWKTPKRSWFQHIKCVETKSEFEDFRGPCGGPKTDISLIDYLAVALDGSRSLEIETIDKEVFRQQLEPGSFYVSSPSSFWHTVEPVIPDAGQSGSQTSLVVRSAVLLRRISGGRAKVNEDGQIERTNGMIYGTRRGFEDLSKRVSDIMQNVFSEVGFRL